MDGVLHLVSPDPPIRCATPLPVGAACASEHAHDQVLLRADTIEAVGLTPVLHKRVRSLSKGYGQRLMLALGLLTPHPLLLMDEPFDGFDLRQTREIVGVLRKEVVKGRTLALAIHQLMDAQRVCDRFILLAGGHVRGAGTLNDLRVRTGITDGSLEDIFLALT